MKAEWRYNKERVIKRAAIGFAIAAVAVAIVSRKKKDAQVEIRDGENDRAFRAE